jgi:hypothetical protein
MRSALRKDRRRSAEAQERRVLNTMLRKQTQRCLLQHCDGRLGDLIERGNRLGVGLVSLLGYDQLGKLGSDIHV